MQRLEESLSSLWRPLMLSCLPEDVSGSLGSSPVSERFRAADGQRPTATAGKHCSPPLSMIDEDEAFPSSCTLTNFSKHTGAETLAWLTCQINTGFPSYSPGLRTRDQRSNPPQLKSPPPILPHQKPSETILMLYKTFINREFFLQQPVPWYTSGVRSSSLISLGSEVILFQKRAISVQQDWVK